MSSRRRASKSSASATAIMLDQKKPTPRVLAVEVLVVAQVVDELVHLAHRQTVEYLERVDAEVELGRAGLGVDVARDEIDGARAALLDADVAAHLRLLQVELLLLLLELHRLDERLLASHDLALLLLLHALALSLLALLLHLLNLFQALLVATTLGLEAQLLGVHAAHEGLLDLLVPHEALGEVGVAEGVLRVRVSRDFTLLQARGELLGLRSGWKVGGRGV